MVFLLLTAPIYEFELCDWLNSRWIHHQRLAETRLLVHMHVHAHMRNEEGSVVRMAAYCTCVLLDLFTASVTRACAPMFRSCSCGGVELLTPVQLQPLSAFKRGPAQQVFRASKVSHRSEHVCVCVSLAASQDVGEAHAASGVVH